MHPDITFMQERICDCDHQKRDKQSVHVNSFLQVSCSLNESGFQQQRNNGILSSIRLSVLFDEIRSFDCGDYHSDLLLMGTI